MEEKEGKVSKGDEAQVIWNESVYLARHLIQWLGGNENRVAHAITILGYASELVLMHGEGDFDKISADYRTFLEDAHGDVKNQIQMARRDLN